MRNLDWTPVRDGEKYCAPACGGGCTFAAYEAAQIGAAEMVKQLGPGWAPQVWENLGWHYCAVRGDSTADGVSVYPSRGRSYMCIVNVGVVNNVVTHADTPREAFEAALAEIQDAVRKVTGTVAQI